MTDRRLDAADLAPPAPSAHSGFGALPGSIFLPWLDSGRPGPFAPTVALIVAHPDDEVIGAGAQLPRFKNLILVHVTDGSPRNLADATRSGFSSREQYAEARRRELQKALTTVGQDQCQLVALGCGDQEASFDLPRLTQELRGFLCDHSPAVILTQPYEGGHPDHDATAFAVHAAVHLLRDESRPELVEMTAYHNESGALRAGEFLPQANRPATIVNLSEAERQLKRELLKCFATQQLTLSAFSSDAEAFRLAPSYDFTQPPHPGTLYYELFDWGVTGERWRELARQALHSLCIDQPI